LGTPPVSREVVLRAQLLPRGAGPLVDTQEDRARCYETCMRAALRHPNFVGYEWFKLGDEPKEGRFDGENSNYGLVDINNKPYDVLVKKMTEVNQAAMGGLPK
jgi:agarase